MIFRDLPSPFLLQPALRAPGMDFASVSSQPLCCSPALPPVPPASLRPTNLGTQRSALNPRTQLPPPRQARRQRDTSQSPSPPALGVESKTQDDSGHSSSPKNGVSSPHPLGCGACCRGRFPGRWQRRPQRSERGGTPNPSTVKLLGQTRWTKTAC